MTEQQWLTSTNPQEILDWATVVLSKYPPHTGIPNWNSAPSDRKLRLFACACCRQVWDGVDPCPGNRAGECCQTNLCPTCHGSGRIGGLTNPRSRRAVEVAELYADGKATEEELGLARVAAHNVWLSRQTVGGGNGWAEYRAYRTTEPDAFPSATGQVPSNNQVESAAQSAILRDIFGNPYRHVTIDPRWLTSNVVDLARTIYEERAWERMPILADALDDAGCDDDYIIQHCRASTRQQVEAMRREAVYGGCCNRFAEYSPCDCLAKSVTHARGCWVLDLLTGRA